MSRYNQYPTEEPTASPLDHKPNPFGASGQPPSFNTNVNRSKTKKWVEAKSYSYDGDDWGGDEFDEYAEEDEPTPPAKPTGLRQQGQGLAQPSAGYRSVTNPEPNAAPLERVRTRSFDQGDDRRTFSGGYPQPASQQQQPIYTTSAPIAESPAETSAAPAGSSHVAKFFGSSSQPLHVETGGANQPNPQPAHRQVSTASAASGISQAPSEVQSDTDFQHRRDFSPSAMPAPLQMRASSRPPTSHAEASGGTFPPRKSSLSQTTSPTGTSQPSALGPTEGSIQDPPARDRASSTSGKPLPFIRPADIYRRMDEERQRERKSLDSERTRSIESSTFRPTLPDAPVPESSATRSSQESQRQPLPAVPASQLPTEEQSGRRPQPTLEPVKERRSESRFEGFALDNPVLARALGAQHVPKSPVSPHASDESTLAPPPSSETMKQPSIDAGGPMPSLPQVNRVSTFGDDFWATTGLGPQKEEERSPAEEQRFRHQPSMGFTSAVHQAFDQHALRPDDSSIPPTPISKEGSLQIGESGISRSNTDSTAGISPIMSRVPSAGTAAARARAAEPRAPAAPSTIQEESRTPSPPFVPTVATHPGSQATPASFIPGYRRDLNTPSPGNSPARSPALEQSRQRVAEAGEVSSTDLTPKDDISPNYPGREANLAAGLAAAIRAKDFQDTSPAAQVAKEAHAAFVPPYDSERTPEMNRSSIPRAESPTKGRVQELAGRFNEISDSRRNSVQSNRSRGSFESWNRSDEDLSARRPASSSSLKELPKSATRPEDSTTDTATPPSHPSAERNESFRPALPGGWISFAPSGPTTPMPAEGSRSTGEGVPTPRIPQPEHQLGGQRGAVDTTRQGPLPPSTANEVARNAPLPETPGSGFAKDVSLPDTPASEEMPDFTPDKKPPREDINKGALASLTAAGAAIGASLMSTAGLGGDSKDEPSSPDTDRTPTRARGSAEYGRNRGDIFNRPLFPDRTVTDATNMTSVPPTPPPKDTPRMDEANDHPEFFSPPVPLKERTQQPPARPPMLPQLSMDPTPEDQESDRLRKEIMRTLSPLKDSQSSDNDQMVPESSSTSRPNRESSALAQVYDSYWEDDEDADQTPAKEQMSSPDQPHRLEVKNLPSPPAETRHDAPISSSPRTATAVGPSKTIFDSRPALLDNRFSWEKVDDDSRLSEDVNRGAPTTEVSRDPTEPTVGLAIQQLLDEDPKLRKFGGIQGAYSGTSETGPAEQQGSALADPVAAEQRLTEHVTAPGAPEESQVEALQRRIEEPSQIPSELPGTFSDETTPTGTTSPAEHSSSAIPIPKFREILAIKNPTERIETYNRTREQFAQSNTGLASWLRSSLDANPELASLASPNNRPSLNTTGLSGSTRHKFSPSVARFHKSGHEPSVASPDAASPAAATTQTATPQETRSTAQQMDKLRQTAGIFSNKAATGAKGLLAKGRSRLQSARQDKAPSPTSEPASAPATEPAQTEATPPRRSKSPFRLSRSSRRSSVVVDAAVPLSEAADGEKPEKSMSPFARALSPFRRRSRSGSKGGDRRPSSIVIPSSSRNVSQEELPRNTRRRSYAGAETYNWDDIEPVPPIPGAFLDKGSQLGVLPSPTVENYPGEMKNRAWEPAGAKEEEKPKPDRSLTREEILQSVVRHATPPISEQATKSGQVEATTDVSQASDPNAAKYQPVEVPRQTVAQMPETQVRDFGSKIEVGAEPNSTLPSSNSSAVAGPVATQSSSRYASDVDVPIQREVSNVSRRVDARHGHEVSGSVSPVTPVEKRISHEEPQEPPVPTIYAPSDSPGRELHPNTFLNPDARRSVPEIKLPEPQHAKMPEVDSSLRDSAYQQAPRTDNTTSSSQMSVPFGTVQPESKTAPEVRFQPSETKVTPATPRIQSQWLRERMLPQGRSDEQSSEDRRYSFVPLPRDQTGAPPQEYINQPTPQPSLQPTPQPTPPLAPSAAPQPDLQQQQQPAQLPPQQFDQAYSSPINREQQPPVVPVQDGQGYVDYQGPRTNGIESPPAQLQNRQHPAYRGGPPPPPPDQERVSRQDQHGYREPAFDPRQYGAEYQLPGVGPPVDDRKQKRGSSLIRAMANRGQDPPSSNERIHPHFLSEQDRTISVSTTHSDQKDGKRKSRRSGFLSFGRQHSTGAASQTDGESMVAHPPSRDDLLAQARPPATIAAQQAAVRAPPQPAQPSQAPKSKKLQRASTSSNKPESSEKKRRFSLGSLFSRSASKDRSSTKLTKRDSRSLQPPMPPPPAMVNPSAYDIARQHRQPPQQQEGRPIPPPKYNTPQRETHPVEMKYPIPPLPQPANGISNGGTFTGPPPGGYYAPPGWAERNNMSSSSRQPSAERRVSSPPVTYRSQGHDSGGYLPPNTRYVEPQYAPTSVPSPYANGYGQQQLYQQPPGRRLSEQYQQPHQYHQGEYEAPQRPRHASTGSYGVQLSPQISAAGSEGPASGEISPVNNSRHNSGQGARDMRLGSISEVTAARSPAQPHPGQQTPWNISLPEQRAYHENSYGARGNGYAPGSSGDPYSYPPPAGYGSPLQERPPQQYIAPQPQRHYEQPNAYQSIPRLGHDNEAANYGLPMSPLENQSPINPTATYLPPPPPPKEAHHTPPPQSGYAVSSPTRHAYAPPPQQVQPTPHLTRDDSDHPSYPSNHPSRASSKQNAPIQSSPDHVTNSSPQQAANGSSLTLNLAPPVPLKDNAPFGPDQQSAQEPAPQPATTHRSPAEIFHQAAEQQQRASMDRQRASLDNRRVNVWTGNSPTSASSNGRVEESWKVPRPESQIAGNGNGNGNGVHGQVKQGYAASEGGEGRARQGYGMREGGGRSRTGTDEDGMIMRGSSYPGQGWSPPGMETWVHD